PGGQAGDGLGPRDGRRPRPPVRGAGAPVLRPVCRERRRGGSGARPVRIERRSPPRGTPQGAAAGEPRLDDAAGPDFRGGRAGGPGGRGPRGRPPGRNLAAAAGRDGTSFTRRQTGRRTVHAVTAVRFGRRAVVANPGSTALFSAVRRRG